MSVHECACMARSVGRLRFASEEMGIIKAVDAAGAMIIANGYGEGSRSLAIPLQPALSARRFLVRDEQASRLYGTSMMPDLRSMGPGGLNLLTVSELSRKLEERQTTSVDIVRDCLNRIAGPGCGYPELGVCESRGGIEAGAGVRREPRRSALHGIPIGIKDIFDTYDMPTEYGSTIYKGFRPATDTALVGLMTRAGMVIIGKCKTTEFASPVPVGVRNPHDFNRSPGVSSSGSAAAVADYMTPLALGSQTGGSDDPAGRVLRRGRLQIDSDRARSGWHPAPAADARHDGPVCPELPGHRPPSSGALR